MNKICLFQKGCFIFLLLISFSCTKEPIASISEVRGEPALVALSLTSIDPESVISRSTRATTQEIEGDINSLHILIFSSNGNLQTLKYIADYKNASSADKQIATHSGNNCTIYAVANMRGENTGTAGDGSFFNDVMTLAQFEAKYATILNGDINRNAGMIMCGKMVTNISPLPTVTVPSQSLKVSRLSSKITINVKDATPSGHTVVLVDYSIVNLPMKVYFANKGSDYFDDHNFEGASAFYSGAQYNFVDASADYGGVATAVKQGQFYMTENRRGVRSAGNVNDQRQKAQYAPVYATYVVINAMYLDQKTAKSMKVAYKIYLGADNSKDYNINRNTQYIYNISINGITQTDVTTTVDSRVNATNTFAFDIHRTTLDAHFEYRPMKIDIFGGWVKIEILKSDGSEMSESEKAASWLKFSKLATFPNNADIQADTDNALRTKEVYSDPDPLVLTVTWRYLYADENISGAERTLKIRITNAATEQDLDGSDPTKKVVVDKDITQKTVDLLGLFGGDFDGPQGYSQQLGIEHFEEHNLLFNNEPAGTEKEGLRWGSSVVTYTDYGTSARDLGKNPTINLAKNAKGLPVGITPPYTQYNNYAARYCYDKNRDTDGDGTINPGEELWYLPAQNQLMAAWMSNVALASSNYWSSTELDITYSYSVYFNGGTGGYNKSLIHRVRCVRDL